MDWRWMASSFSLVQPRLGIQVAARSLRVKFHRNSSSMIEMMTNRSCPFVWRGARKYYSVTDFHWSLMMEQQRLALVWVLSLQHQLIASCSLFVRRCVIIISHRRLIQGPIHQLALNNNESCGRDAGISMPVFGSIMRQREDHRMLLIVKVIISNVIIGLVYCVAISREPLYFYSLAPRQTRCDQHSRMRMTNYPAQVNLIISQIILII